MARIRERNPADTNYMPNSAHDPIPTSSVAVWDDERLRLIHGDALTALHQIPDDSIHAVVTDPPYAIDKGEADASDEELMGSAMLGMQSQNWNESATHSRGYADNDPAIFQRWCAAWLTECHRVLKPGGHLIAFGGTRTWHLLASAAESTGLEIRDCLVWLYASGFPKGLNVEASFNAAGDSDGAERWKGWGTTLKPGFEPIVLARKQVEGTVIQNLAVHSTGALNLGACRLSIPGTAGPSSKWPANVHVDEATARKLSETSATPAESAFFVSKPSSRERTRANGVEHPTVKPLDLMRHLVRLVTPEGGTVLDPFAGSGTTLEAAILEGFNAIGVERETDYIPLILERIRRRATPFQSDADLGDAILMLPL